MSHRIDPQIAQISQNAGQEMWIELRDERGKLCARLDVERVLLEVRRNGQPALFDLAEYLRGQISEF